MEYDHIKYNVEKFLREKGIRDEENAVSPVQIARVVFEDEKATRKMINPSLYRMEKEDIIIKVCEENGRKPRWYLPIKV